MNILAIELSTTTGSVALLQDEECGLHEQFVSERSHSALLFPVLERARQLCGKMDMIAIGLGPGSYAGVRIAIAAGLGMQMVMSAELVGIPSTAALETEHAEYVVVGDARRATFYWTRVAGGVCVEGPLLLNDAELRDRLTGNRLPVLSSEQVPGNPDVPIALPSALRLANLAKLSIGIVARGDLEPIYLREPHITQPKKRAAI